MASDRPGYYAALLGTAVRAGFAKPGPALLQAGMMLANNLVLWVIWELYFSRFSALGGWGVRDLAILFGLVAWAFGTTMFLFGGVRELARRIADGALDLHLGRPRHPLPSLLMARSGPSGLGDMASALVFWLWLAERPAWELPWLLLLGSAAAVVVTATATLMQCLAFWIRGAAQFAEELFQIFLMLAFYPQHPYGFLVRLMLFTLLPTAFIGLLPVEAVRDGDWLKGLGVIAAAGFYAALAVLVFDRGLGRYSSGNRLLELR